MNWICTVSNVKYGKSIIVKRSNISIAPDYIYACCSIKIIGCSASGYRSFKDWINQVAYIKYKKGIVAKTGNIGIFSVNIQSIPVSQIFRRTDSAVGTDMAGFCRT